MTRLAILFSSILTLSTSALALPNKPVCVEAECSLAKLNTLRSIADRGDKEMSFSLGHVFMSSESGIRKDLENAFYYFNKSAKQGFWPAHRQAASMLAQGIGTEKDLTEAKRLMKRAAQRGVSKTAEEYAVLVFSDPESTDEERDIAISFLQKAADSGMSYLGNYMLAVLHIDGQYVEKDLDRAAKLLAFPASGNYANAKAMLSQLTEGNIESYLANTATAKPSLDPNIETISVSGISLAIADVNDMMLKRLERSHGQTGSRIKGKGCRRTDPNCKIIEEGFMKNQTFWVLR